MERMPITVLVFLMILGFQNSRRCNAELDTHAARHPPRDLQQIRLHVYDVMLPVPIAGEEVLDSVGFEQDGAVDELGLLGAGVVPE